MNTILTKVLASSFLPEGSNSKVYSFSKGNNSSSVSANILKNAISAIEYFFAPISGLISKPTFTITPSKVSVDLFYYLPSDNESSPFIENSKGNDTELNNSAVNALGEILSKIFNCDVSVKLVRLHYPYLNSYILAQYIAINSHKYNFSRMQRMIFSNVPTVQNAAFNVSNSTDLSIKEDGLITETLKENKEYVTHLTGIKIQISGRSTTQSMSPRQTVQRCHIGSFAKNNKTSISCSTFTSKNKTGAFSVKVWLSQKTQ